MNKDRYQEIDLLKGFGIVLMIMGHVPVSEGITRLIYVFHMPLFFVASGFLYKCPRKGEKIIRKWIKRLLIPYIIFATAGYTLWFVEVNPTSINEMLVPLLSIVWSNTSGMPINGAIWYLTATFVVYLLWWKIDSKISKHFVKEIVILLLTLFGFHHVVEIPLPYGMDVALVGIGFFYCGVLLRKNYSSLLCYMEKGAYRKMMLPIIGVLASCLGYQNGYVSMRVKAYGDRWTVFFMAAILLVSVLLFTAKYMEDYFPSSLFLTWLKDIGKNSIIYLGLNELIINVIGSILSKAGVGVPISRYLTLILSCLLLTAIVQISKRMEIIARLFCLK